MPDTLRKQPSESFLYDMDFAPRLKVGETVTSITSIVQQELNTDTLARTTTTDLTLSGQAFSGQLVQVRITAGLTSKAYVLTFKVGTSLSNSVEAEGILLVTDT
jgi:hypothetical protein